MYVLVESKDFHVDETHFKYMILYYDKDYNYVKEKYDIFQDLKVKIFLMDDEDFKYYGMSMRSRDHYFNPGDWKEVLVLEN